LNKNGTTIPDGSKITDAQAFVGYIGNGKYQVHLQYKVDTLEGYHSCDEVITWTPEEYEKSKSMGGCKSFSGSENSKYFKVEFEDDELSYLWWIKKPELKLKFGLSIDSNQMTHVTWDEEVKDEPTTQAKEAETEADFWGSDEVPF
jgi:hypothetical protein